MDIRTFVNGNCWCFEIPLFGTNKKKEQTTSHVEEQQNSIEVSIKTAPRYKEVIQYMSEWTGRKWNIRVNPMTFAILPEPLLTEYATDELRIIMITSSSFIEHVNNVNFQNFLQVTLDSLDCGVNANGGTIVGLRKTIVDRRLVDGVVNCMNDIFGTRWKELKVFIHKNQMYPIQIANNQLIFIVAPISLNIGAWEQGKYTPDSKTPTIKQEIIIKNIDVNDLLRQLRQEGIVAVYRCPHCGGNLKVERETSLEQLKVCPYCNLEIETIKLAEFLKTALS